MTFEELWGEELDIQLSSKDRTNLFTTARRKAQVNNGMREFARLTECVKKTASIAMVDETATYDIEATASDFWWLCEQEGISIARDNGTTVTYLVEGERGGLTRVDKRRLDREHPGWRAADPGTPRYFYLDTDGGQSLLGFYPPPDIPATETWTLSVPYVPEVPDMTATSDEPFTFSSNVAKRLRAWHMALVHYAASKLETARKQGNNEKAQLEKFSGYVKDYLDKQRPPGGDVVAYAHDYVGQRRAGTFAGDPMVDW